MRTSQPNTHILLESSFIWLDRCLTISSIVDGINSLTAIEICYVLVTELSKKDRYLQLEKDKLFYELKAIGKDLFENSVPSL